jgi:hypothetical protein
MSSSRGISRYKCGIIARLFDSSVGIALGYGLDDRGSRFRFLAGAGNFSLHHRVQNGSGAHPASYPMDTGGSFPAGKAGKVPTSRMRGSIPPLPQYAFYDVVLS